MRTHPFFSMLLAQAVLLLGIPFALQFGAGGEHIASVAPTEAQFPSADEVSFQEKAKDKKDKEAKKDKTDHGALKHLKVNVGGQERKALVAYPKSKGSKEQKDAAPVVFAFHGHGNTMEGAARSFGFHDDWHEAICVYPQGLKTPSVNDPQGKESGWELRGDRDYLFFDALLAKLKKEHAVDSERIFAAGFSNGAHFTYGLWDRRGAVLRAVAPVAGFYDVGRLSPKPCLVITGAKDKKHHEQLETFQSVRKVNGCEGKGVDWPKHKSKLDGTLYRSSKGAPSVKLTHDSGHMVPNAAGRLIVEFFKEVSPK